MSKGSSQPQVWYGDMLDEPDQVELFTHQLRTALAEYVDYVARIRRDAEAMWKANPPAEYSSFEAWWRHHKVTGPFAELQDHLEKAVKLTFEVAAQHRRQRHEIPERRQAAAQARQEASALNHSAPPRRLNGGGQPYPAPKPRRNDPADGSFMDMLDGHGRSA